MEEFKNIQLLNTDNDKSMRALIKSSGNFYIDTSFSNILRRFIVSNIDTYTFYYINKENKNTNIKEIVIDKETKTNINNDMLGHRISLLSINVFTLEILVLFNYFKNYNTIPKIDEFEISQDDLYKPELKFYINQEYSNQSSMDYENVTENHIKNDLFQELLDGETNESMLYWEKINQKVNGKSALDDLINKYNENENESETKDQLTLFKPFIYTYQEQDGEIKTSLHYNILTKIKSEQIVKVEMYLMKNCVSNDNYTDNNIRYSPVSACRSTFVIDYIKVLTLFLEKHSDIDPESNEINIIRQEIIPIIYDNDDLKNIIKKIYEKEDNTSTIKRFLYFCIEEAERYYFGVAEQKDRVHLLEYDSIDFYTPKTILIKGLESLINNNKYHNINIFEKIGTTFTTTNSYSINRSTKLNSAYDIIIYNGNHGLGYLMQSYLKFMDKKEIITYIGYRITHPLENKLLLTIQFKEDNDDEIPIIFINTYEYLQSIVIELLEQLKQ